MKATKENMIKEAVKRMKKMHIMANVVQEFEKEGTVYYSENLGGSFGGMLYWLTNEPEYVKLKEEIEEDMGCVIYHAELCHTSIGDLLSFLYVSNETEEWEYDQDDLDDGYCYAVVQNLTTNVRDYGTIKIKPCNGGIKRIQ